MPVVGHLFLPTDRIFAWIEAEIKKKEIIVDPEEYETIFSKFGTVIPLVGIVKIWKETTSAVLKLLINDTSNLTKGNIKLFLLLNVIHLHQGENNWCPSNKKQR